MNSKAPPYSDIAEKTVLGQVLVYQGCIKESAALLSADDFYVSAHRVIYEQALELNKVGTPPLLNIIAQRLIDKGLMERVGGIAFLSQLTDSVATKQTLEHYARIIKEKAVLRRLVHLTAEIGREAMETGDAQKFLQESKKAIIELASVSLEKKPIQSIGDGLQDVVKEIMSGEPPAGLVKTHIRSLDEKTGGLFSELVTIVAGDTSMGKSAFLLNIAMNIGFAGGKVLYYTLEDAKRFQQKRALARLARINLHRIMVNRLDHQRDENRKLLEAQVKMLNQNRPLFWIQDKICSADEIAYSAKMHKETHGLDVLIVDHLGFVISDGKTDYERISNAMRAFVAMAKDLRVPVALAHQINRNRSKEGRPRPSLKDLRDSGKIEQDARMVWFVHRPHKDDKKNDPHLLEVNVAKASHGALGPIELYCDMSQMYIRDKREGELSDHQDETAWQDTGYN
jgi:replicative DNA helicase